jgi:hypothetical protein
MDRLFDSRAKSRLAQPEHGTFSHLPSPLLIALISSSSPPPLPLLFLLFSFILYLFLVHLPPPPYFNLLLIFPSNSHSSFHSTFNPFIAHSQ